MFWAVDQAYIHVPGVRRLEELDELNDDDMVSPVFEVNGSIREHDFNPSWTGKQACAAQRPFA